MAEFSTNRLSDTSPISTVDDALAAAERDHANIFGIPTDDTISGSIFGAVDLNARIIGDSSQQPARVPQIYNISGTESAAAAIDFSNVEGGNNIGWRIVPIGGELRLYEREPHDENVGTLIKTLSNADLFTNLGDTTITDLSVEAGNILAVSDIDPYPIIGIPPSQGTGVNNFYELDDTPISYAGAVAGMVVTCAGDPVDHLEFAAQASGGQNYFVDLWDVFSSYSNAAQHSLAVTNAEDGIVSQAHYWARARNTASTALSYTVASGLINWGAQLSSFPVSNGMIQNDTLYFQRDPYRDSIYQVVFSVVINSGAEFQRVGVSLDTGTEIEAEFLKIVYVLGGGEAAPPVTIDGTFLVRVLPGTGLLSNRAVSVRIGHVVSGTLQNWSFGVGSSGQTIYIGARDISITRVN